MPTTPKKLHRFVREICARLVAGSEPVWVPVVPIPTAQLNECFFNVRERINVEGGSIQHGWCIWEEPGIFVEGEFHAVWRRSDDSLCDITPKRDHEIRILFLPDPVEVFDEKAFERRDNVRLAQLDHPKVHEFIKHMEAFHRLKENGTAPNDPRRIILNRDEYEWYLNRQVQLGRELGELPCGRNDLCRCGSGEKHKKCCGA